MPAPARHALRLVVQHVQEQQRSFYRLIAYGDGPTFRPVEVPSRQQLMEKLRGVLPGLDEGSLAAGAGGTYIAFTQDVKLDGRQLRVLGLLS